jgi:hypothetical protein
MEMRQGRRQVSYVTPTREAVKREGNIVPVLLAQRSQLFEDY